MTLLPLIKEHHLGEIMYNKVYIDLAGNSVIGLDRMTSGSSTDFYFFINGLVYNIFNVEGSLTYSSLTYFCRSNGDEETPDITLFDHSDKILIENVLDLIDQDYCDVRAAKSELEDDEVDFLFRNFKTITMFYSNVNSERITVTENWL